MSMIAWTRDVEWKRLTLSPHTGAWRTQSVLCYGGYEMATKQAMVDVVGVQDMRAVLHTRGAGSKFEAWYDPTQFSLERSRSIAVLGGLVI